MNAQGPLDAAQAITFIASAMAVASIIIAPMGVFLFYDRSFTDLGLYVMRCSEIWLQSAAEAKPAP